MSSLESPVDGVFCMMNCSTARRCDVPHTMPYCRYRRDAVDMLLPPVVVVSCTSLKFDYSEKLSILFFLFVCFVNIICYTSQIVFSLFF